MMKNVLRKRTPRERYLLIGLLLVGILIWSNALLSQWQASARERSLVRMMAEEQQLWLGQQEQIEARLATVLHTFDAEFTFSSSGLVAAIDSLARDLALDYELASPQTVAGDILATHSLRIRLRRESLPQLLFFEENLLNEAPYIIIQELRLTPFVSDPRLLDAQLSVQAFELNRQP